MTRFHPICPTAKSFYLNPNVITWIRCVFPTILRIYYRITVTSEQSCESQQQLGTFYTSYYESSSFTHVFDHLKQITHVLPGGLTPRAGLNSAGHIRRYVGLARTILYSLRDMTGGVQTDISDRLRTPSRRTEKIAQD